MLVIVSNMQLWGCLKGSEYPDVLVLWCKVGKREGRPNAILFCVVFVSAFHKGRWRCSETCHEIRVVTGTSRVISVRWGYTVGVTFPVEIFFWVGVGGVYELISHLQCDGLRADFRVNEKYSKKLIFHSQHYMPPAPYEKITSTVEFIV